MKQLTKVAENNVVDITKSTVRKGNKKSVQLNDDFEIVMHKAEQLHEQYKQFDEQYIQRTNDALYALLAEMQKVCLHVQSLATREAVVAKLRKRLKSEYDIKTQKNSTEVGIIVRYALRTARKTAHLYARVLQTAIDAGIKAEDLADYIRERGGVENIRKATVDEATRDARNKLFSARKAGLLFMFEKRHNGDAMGTVQWNGDTGIQNYGRGASGDLTVLIAMNNKADNSTKIVGTLLDFLGFEDYILDRYNSCVDFAARDRLGFELGNAFRKYGIAEGAFWNWAKHNGVYMQEEANKFLKGMVEAVRDRDARYATEDASKNEAQIALRNVA